jgi:hypothetical protein
MEMPYKDLKSKNLTSLVNVIKLVTVLSYAGLVTSLIAIIPMNLVVETHGGSALLLMSIFGLFLSGLLAICVSLEESYRQKVTTQIEISGKDK